MTVQQFLVEEYDYVIVGGGTAGLVVAARLSEDPNIKVAVIEAGKDHSEQPTVNTPGLHIGSLGHPDLDWDFRTVPQKDAAGKVHGLARGKGLGGSSAINFAMFSQASRRDLDNWQACGNDRWDFETLAPYYRKFETYHALPPDVAKQYMAEYIDPKLRGTKGPIQISLAERGISWLAELFPPTCLNAAYPHPHDPRNGSSLGGFNQLTCTDPAGTTRSYAASGYWWPNKDRPNLAVLTEALATKVELSDETTPRATGVSFEKDGTTHVVRARREVIVCAGTVQSPQLLECSGVGGAALLQQHGISVKVDNANVGENMQDHIMALNGWQAMPNVPTAEAFRDPNVMQAVMKAYAEHKAGPLASFATAVSFVSLSMLMDGDEAEVKRIAALADDCSPVANTPLVQKQHALAKAQLLASDEAAVQCCVMPFAFDNTDPADVRAALAHETFADIPGLSVGVALERPLSRGTVHIRSPHMADPPVIDPQYFSHPLDVEIAAAGLLHFQKIVTTAPLSEKVLAASDGTKVPLPNCRWLKDLADARDFVRGSCLTQWHVCGTCIMLPREMGGVVDQEGRVYGTRGLRICDASIFPMVPQGNIMSLVYAVAERISDMIKEGAKA